MHSFVRHRLLAGAIPFAVLAPLPALADTVEGTAVGAEESPSVARRV